MRTVALALALFTVSLDSPAFSQPCGQTGGLGVPALTISSDLWDDDFDLVLADARPLAPCAILADISPGPTPIPGGSLCVGPSPFLFFGSTSTSGAFAIEGAITPALSLLIGVPIYLQGIVVDPSSTTGMAQSQQLAHSIRAPRAILLQQPSAGGREAAVYDTFGLAAGTPALVDTIPLADAFNHQLALHPDGHLMVARRLTSGAQYQDLLDAYDISTVPAQLLGGGSLPFTGPNLVELPVLVTRDAGFAVTGGSVLQRFDTDPSSPTFMAPNAQVTLVGEFITDLVASRDGDVLYVLAADFQMGELVETIDPTTMTVTKVTVLARSVPNPSNAVSLLSRITPSPDDSLLAVLLAGTNNVPPELFVVDRATLAQMSAMPLMGVGQSRAYFEPQDPTNKTIVFAESFGFTGGLRRVDWTTGALLQTEFLNYGLPFDLKLGMTPNGNFLHLADRAGGMLYVFDAALNPIASHSTLPATDPVGSHFMIVESR